MFQIKIGNKKINSKSPIYIIAEAGVNHNGSITLAKKFRLRGIPTTIIFNKKGEEFARIIGSTDFGDKKFIDWLSSYN